MGCEYKPKRNQTKLNERSTRGGGGAWGYAPEPNEMGHSGQGGAVEVVGVLVWRGVGVGARGVVVV